MRKISLLLLSVVLVSGCEDKEKETPEITKIKETDEYYNCVIQESRGLNSITSTMEKMIEKKCINEYKVKRVVPYELTENEIDWVDVWESFSRPMVE
jgi:hypothetical protein